ncbi:MAG TPA: hypothetical protein VGL97_21885 [Bryobacteraceae bacterium]
MQRNLLRLVALTWSCLLTAPLSGFAQFDNDTAATSLEKTATIPSGNAAEAALQRAVTCATAAAFSPALPTAGSESKYLEDVAYCTDQAQGNPQSQTKPPASKPAAPSLPDLFPQSQTQPNAQLQARLNERTHMLKIHQTLGLITAIPMVATLFTGPQAKAKGKNGETITEPTSANLDSHIALGALTTGLYWTTAYYAIFAPKIPGVKPKGAIRLHRDLEWVHGPGMILTGILGIMAYRQESAGEKVHGIASAHGTVAYVTAAAYGASIVSVSWPIHLKFWK